ncbi:hypothetical protein VTJ49DRAFT_6107 [Mycothermus thermophilus]|uniref:FAS1 domain-containing protein n=1 Tax=Humicola insolens TaxID=85995 RepID=A0ABR3V1W5_HUMIN
MRLSVPLVIALGSTVPGQLVVPHIHRDVFGDQSPLLSPAMPPTDTLPQLSSFIAREDVLLSDVMGRDKSISSFASSARDIEPTARLLDDPSRNTTVLAPQNSAVEGLGRKPWENPRDYDKFGPDAYQGPEGLERARRNIRRFVEAHMIPASPWKQGDRVRPVVGGGEVWWEEKGDTRLIQPDGITVVGVVGDVGNGQVWIIKGVRDYLKDGE